MEYLRIRKIRGLKMSLGPTVSRNVNHWAIIVLLRNNQVLTNAASSNLQWKLSTDLRKCYKKTGNDIACSAEACRELQCAGAAALPGAAGSACAGDHRATLRNRLESRATVNGPASESFVRWDQGWRTYC